MSRQGGAVRHHCLAVCAPGLEELCAAELAGLGVRIRRTLVGGVELSATERQLYASNAWSRTATRIVVRAAMFSASSFAELEHAAAEVPWERWVPAGTSPVVRVSSTSSRLYHTGAVAERLVEVAGTGPGAGPLLVTRIIHDRVTLSIDSSGDPLHLRGWRRHVGKAPLRETLAAALVLASGWDRRSPLVDPFCGSGTIAIEAALLAAGRAPGEGRRFAFQDWPSFQPGTWASVAAEMENMAHPPTASPPSPVVIAADRDAGAVRAATANAERAGVVDAVSVRRASLSQLDVPPGPGWVVTNPPYGKRLSGGGDLRDLFAALGSVAREHLAGWSLGMLVADRSMAAHAGLRLEERLRTSNGGIPVRFLTTPTPPALVGDDLHHRGMAGGQQR